MPFWASATRRGRRRRARRCRRRRSCSRRPSTCLGTMVVSPTPGPLDDGMASIVYLLASANSTKASTTLATQILGLATITEGVVPPRRHQGRRRRRAQVQVRAAAQPAHLAAADVALLLLLHPARAQPRRAAGLARPAPLFLELLRVAHHRRHPGAEVRLEAGRRPDRISVSARRQPSCGRRRLQRLLLPRAHHARADHVVPFLQGRK